MERKFIQIDQDGKAWIFTSKDIGPDNWEPDWIEAMEEMDAGQVITMHDKTVACVSRINGLVMMRGDQTNAN